jgi:hypothetical protein
MDDLVDFLIIHQGIIDADDAMAPQDIIIYFLSAEIMTIPKIFKEVMKDVCPCRDDHIDQSMFNHIADHLTHPARNHGSRQTHKNDAVGILEHLSKDVEALEHISALEGSVLEGLDEVNEAPGLFRIQVADGAPQISGFPLLIHRSHVS